MLTSTRASGGGGGAARQRPYDEGGGRCEHGSGDPCHVARRRTERETFRYHGEADEDHEDDYENENEEPHPGTPGGGWDEWTVDR